MHFLSLTIVHNSPWPVGKGNIHAEKSKPVRNTTGEFMSIKTRGILLNFKVYIDKEKKSKYSIHVKLLAPLITFPKNIIIRAYSTWYILFSNCHLNYCHGGISQAFTMDIPYRGNCNVRRHRSVSDQMKISLRWFLVIFLTTFENSIFFWNWIVYFAWRFLLRSISFGISLYLRKICSPPYLFLPILCPFALSVRPWVA